MTQPDKWDEIAFGLFAGKSGMVDEPGMIRAATTALRSAYAEGEKAGMERAGKIVGREGEYYIGLREGVIIDRIAQYLIRAAKETKE